MSVLEDIAPANVYFFGGGSSRLAFGRARGNLLLLRLITPALG